MFERNFKFLMIKCHHKQWAYNNASHTSEQIEPSQASDFNLACFVRHSIVRCCTAPGLAIVPTNNNDAHSEPKRTRN